MENIRAFFENETLDICVEKISNKLLSIPEYNQKLYAKMLVSEMETHICEISDYNLSRCPDGEWYMDNELVSGINLKIGFFQLLYSLINIFNYANICIIDIMDELKCKALKKCLFDSPYNFVDWEKDRQNYISAKKKVPIAKTTEQVDAILALLKSDSVEYSSDTDLAKFISWLCGGSEKSIRQNGLCRNTGYNNESVLKEKFSLIGLIYDKGKIRDK